jgi:hypothetical protein
MYHISVENNFSYLETCSVYADFKYCHRPDLIALEAPFKIIYLKIYLSAMKGKKYGHINRMIFSKCTVLTFI